jgi:hypothetical protein
MTDPQGRRDRDDAAQRAVRGLARWFVDLVEDAVEAAGEDAGGEPGQPVPAGGVAPTVTVPAAAVQTLTTAALAAAYGPPGSAPPAQVIWADADGEVLVHIDQTRVVLFPGLALVALTLETDQTGPGQVVVPFALGSPSSPAGMLAVTETRPRGPQALVDRWGQAAIAAAWLALLDLTHGLALQSGVDADGARLIPGAVATDGTALSVVPQARHAGDRVVGR